MARAAAVMPPMRLGSRLMWRRAQVQGHLARKVKGGRIGNRVESLGVVELSQDQSYQGLHAYLTPGQAPSIPSARPSSRSAVVGC